MITEKYIIKDLIKGVIYEYRSKKQMLSDLSAYLEYEHIQKFEVIVLREEK